MVEYPFNEKELLNLFLLCYNLQRVVLNLKKYATIPNIIKLWYIWMIKQKIKSLLNIRANK